MDIAREQVPWIRLADLGAALDGPVADAAAARLLGSVPPPPLSLGRSSNRLRVNAHAALVR
jgi:hypothetical protein